MLFYRLFDYHYVSIDPAIYVIAGAACYMIATILNLIIRSLDGGGSNIFFGIVGIAGAGTWVASAIFQQSVIGSNGIDWPSLWIAGSVLNSTIIIYDMITICKNKKKNSCCTNALFIIALICALLGNLLFIGGAAWFLFIINTDYWYDGYEMDDNFWNDDDKWWNNDNTNWEDDDFWNNDDNDVWNDDYIWNRTLSSDFSDINNSIALLIGGSSMHLVFSMLQFCAILSKFCCRK